MVSPGDGDARGRLQREAHYDVLARGNAAEHAAGMIALEAPRRQFIAMLGAALLDRPESRADLDAFNGIDAHHGARKIRVEPLEHGLAPARRHALGDHGHARADGISGLADAAR